MRVGDPAQGEVPIDAPAVDRFRVGEQDYLGESGRHRWVGVSVGC